MFLRYFLWLSFLVWTVDAPCQDAIVRMAAEGELMVIDQYADEQGFYVFAPSRASERKHIPVVFVHGYGALNPMIYGGWIRHLTDLGHVVIYPRYQKGLLSTSAEDFVPYTASAIRNAMEATREKKIHLDDQMYLIGHSYGGVIISNIAATWKELELPEPKIAMLCEPGSGPLNGGLLDSYEDIGSDLQLMIIVGDEDQTVGHKFGEFVFASAVNTPSRALLRQFGCAQDSLSVSASHYEPYSLDPAFDNGIENFTSKRAVRLARTDWVDRDGYWKIFDILVGRERSAASGPYSEREMEMLCHLGVWPDNTPLRKMDYRLPDALMSK